MDYLFPYEIIEENGFYGLVDSKGNYLVPCTMDEIVNLEDEELGLSLWSDYDCLYLYKDGKIGFFTSTGKYIAPVYDDGTASPDRCIYVLKDEQYGLFRWPEYEFEEIEAEHSLLTESELYDWEELEEKERHIIRTDYKVGESIILKGCGPDMESWKNGKVIFVSEKNVIVKVECYTRLLAVDINRDCLTDEDVEAITGKNIEELKTYEHDRFIDALDPYMLYPYNVFNVPGFDPMEFA